MAKVYLAMRDLFSSDDPDTTLNIEQTKCEHVFSDEKSAEKWLNDMKDAQENGATDSSDEIQEVTYLCWSKNIHYEIGYISKWNQCKKDYEYYILEYEVEP